MVFAPLIVGGCTSTMPNVNLIQYCSHLTWLVKSRWVFQEAYEVGIDIWLWTIFISWIQELKRTYLWISYHYISTTRGRMVLRKCIWSKLSLYANDMMQQWKGIIMSMFPLRSFSMWIDHYVMQDAGNKDLGVIHQHSSHNVMTVNK